MVEVANCAVRLNGDIGYEVPKQGIAYAEVVVLRAIHGDDAVVRLEKAGTDERSLKDVLEHLRSVYGEARIRAVFPGANPNINTRFYDLTNDPVDDIPTETVSTAKKVKAAPAIDPSE